METDDPPKRVVEVKNMKKVTVKDLTLEEKVSLLTGKDIWRLHTFSGKLPEVFVADGPHGLRMVSRENAGNWGGEVYKTTAMPNVVNVANTWNPACAYETGKVIADECIEHDADVLLAPGVNIKRSPLCGRNFEYFSEDPYLAGVMGVEYVKGVQDKGVGTSLKHYALNNSENDRSSMTAEADERTMREIYLRPFELILQETKPTTVMCSYNKVNGIHTSENRYLLKDILRDIFGFDGIVISDWGACHNRWKSVKAALDLCMPVKEDADAQVMTALKNGWISEADVDYCVENLLNFIYRIQDMKPLRKLEFTEEQRLEKATAIATESMVLLQNENSALPLKKIPTLLLGRMAEFPAACGGGSSEVSSCHTHPHLKDLLAEKLGVEVTFRSATEPHFNGLTAARECMDLAARFDQVVVVVGEDTSLVCEGMNRTDIKLHPKHLQLIDNVTRVCDNVIVVIEAGSAVDTSEFQDKVNAILYAGYAGDAVNYALSDLLTGAATPSGKLSETFPYEKDDFCPDINFTPCGVDRYVEGIFVGYRGADAMDADVLYPFGHGLSYVNFRYENLQAEKKGETDYVISYDIYNEGDMDAAEVSQVYVGQAAARVARPVKELKAFSKDVIPARGKKHVSVTLDKSAFAYYNVCLKDWHVENGAFTVYVGASSRDIRLKKKLIVALPDETQFT